MPWPLSDAGRVEEGGAVTASTTLTTVTAHATAHTKGSYTELLAATGFDTSGLMLRLGGAPSASGVDSSTLLDIAVGAAGSEVVLVANIPLGGYISGDRYAWVLPVRVPAATRIAARTQSAVTSQAITLQVVPFGGGFLGPEGYARATTYGSDTATSSAVQPTTAGTLHTKGAWTQVNASIVNPMRALTVCVAAPVTNSATTAAGLLDIGVGASGSEIVIVPNVNFSISSAEQCQYVPITVPVNQPAGVRVACRYQSASTAAGAKPSVAFIGYD
jgi:hypothetical protein